MAQDKGQLGLDIAQRSKPGKDTFDYRAASTEQWIQNLPMGNIGETARLVYETLHEVNRLAISWKDRFRFLELLRQPYHYVQTSLNRHFVGMSFPLSNKSQRIATLAVTLSSEMALGYKTAIEEMLGSSFLSRDSKAMTVMIHRAIRYISQSMLISYQTYAAHPGSCWRELNALYLYAEHKGVYQDRVKDELNTLLPESSIARAYKQILLLALASPYRLRQGEAETVYNALAHYAGYAHVIPYSESLASEVLFSVDMDSDKAPDYLVFSQEVCNSKHCRLVDTRELSKKMYAALEKGEELAGMSKLPKQLVVRLIRTWGIAPKRNFTRNERHANVEIAIGITMLHRVLAEAQGTPEMHTHRSSYDSKAVVGVSQPTTDDVWDIRASSNMKRDYDHYKSITDPDEPAVVKHTIKLHLCQVLNESAGGYRLSLENAENAGLKVGELLGIRQDTDGAPWETGVIRWLRNGGEGRMEAGIQVLAPHARPVMVSNSKASGAAAESQYALLLPEIPALKQPHSIITPALLYKPGIELSVNLPNQSIKLKLGSKLQDSGVFVQYTYSSAEKFAKSPAKRSKPEQDEDGFNQVWDEL